MCCSGSEPHRYRITHVSFGSLADIIQRPRHVCFTSTHAAGSMHSSMSFLTLLTARLTA
jgi:hypothetical protein